MSKARWMAILGLVVILALAACTPAAATEAPAANEGAAEEPAAPAEKSVVNFYTDSDTNISDWMMNVIGPAFEAKYPQYEFNVVIVRGIGNGDADIADRAFAALQTNSDPQVEVLEFDATSKPELIDGGLWLKLDATNVPNAANVLEGLQTSEFSMPYRGSQVLLAYDSSKLADADVPRTFPDLMEWVKANPGQFVYCRPDKGGSGGNFVIRAIYEATGKDPTIFKSGTPDPAIVAEFPKAWELLRDIHPAIYDNGAYPSGNNPVLELLANGSVTMATVWSDQALVALEQGVLPETIKLAQLTDLPFPGGSTRLSIPKNAANVEGALAFLDFMLSNEGQLSVLEDIGGFPAVSWDTLPAESQEKYQSVIADTVPNWPGGEWDAERNKGWYENVATNIQQDSE